MAGKSYALDHFRAFVKLLDGKHLAPETFGKAIGIGRSGAFQRLREFRRRGWITGSNFDDAKVTPEGRVALEADEAPPFRARAEPPEPRDLRCVLAAPSATIAALRRAYATAWGPGFLAELGRVPAPAQSRRAGAAPKPRDLIDLLDLPRELVAAVLHLLAFPWGDRLLERVELEPLAKAAPRPPATRDPSEAADQASSSMPVPSRERAPASPAATPAPKLDSNAHFSVYARDGSVRSSHVDLGEAKRAMLRDAKGVKVVRCADGKVMTNKDKPR